VRPFHGATSTQRANPTATRRAPTSLSLPARPPLARSAAETQLAKDRVRAEAAERERKSRPAAAKQAAASEHDFVLDQHLRDDRPKLTVAETDASIKRQRLTAHTFQGLSFTVFASRIFFRTDDEDLERAVRATERIRAAAPRPSAAGAAASASASAAADA